MSSLSIFGKSMTIWNYIPFGGCDYIVSDTMICNNGQVILNNKSYSVIRKSNDTIAFIREDTTLGKVWYKKPKSSREYLIMDLNLNKNDTFLLYDYSNKTTPIIVDSTFVVNGIKHVKFKVSEIRMCSLSEQFEFTEGVGTNAGFMYQGLTEGSSIGSYLLCVYKDNTQIYTNKLFHGQCKVIDVGVKSVDNNIQVIAFPNPSKGEINFQFGKINKTPYSIEIYSIDGKILISKSFFGDNFNIDIRRLSTGIYFYKIVNSSSNKYFGKIIKE